MGFLEIMEIVVCIFAVYGVYALVCRLLGHGCYKGDLSVAIHKTEGETGDAIHRAIILTEAQNGKMRSPVILLEKTPSAEEEKALRECGCRLYSRIS
ncbi:MAG: hypothetical protein IJ009_05290 [Clostridia bacterium]|nr:hypothetical protein [Clostridia bacterium]